ncbi:MAG: glycoside hydrolase [Bacteroidia bacterium]|nr:glycoside hydrolase [Bacteroidia bacterium]
MRRFLALGGALLLLSGRWEPTPSQLRTSASYFPWEPVGPTNLGHNLITGIRVGNAVYVASAFGGLFRSTDMGRSWQIVGGFSLNNNDENIYRCPSVTALAAEGNVLYVGTGAIQQYNPSGISLARVATTKGGVTGAFGRPGMGVFVSTDGGTTFSNQNATWKLTYPNISYAHDYTNVGVINVADLAVQNGKIAVLTPDTLLLSSDGLTTLQGTGRIAGGKRLRSVAWGANDNLFVTSDDSLYRSTDGGLTFSPVTNITLPSGLTGVAGIGGGNAIVRSAPSNPSILYLLSARSDGSLVGVWASPDNGNTWTRIANQENASFAVLGTVGTSVLTLEVDPNDPAHIVIGGRQLWDFSPDRGWQRINPSNQDPFILRLPSNIRDVVFLENGELLVLGDGRLVRVTQNGTRIEDANRGIQASRVLSVAVSPSGDVHISGASPILISSTYPEDPAGIFRLVNGVSTGFEGVTSPFGLVQSSLLDPEIVFFSYQDGRLRTAQDRGRSYVSFYATPASYSWDTTNIQPPGSGSGTPAWISQDRPERFGPLYPPFALAERFQDPVKGTDNKIRGTSYLFIATSTALWTITNPISTSPDSIAHWNRVSGTTAISNLNASHTYANYLSGSNQIPTALAVDSAYTVWIGTSNGRLLRVRNAHDITINRTSQNGVEDLTASIASLVDDRWISAIAVHPTNPNLVAIGVGSYASPIDRIFLSTDATSANPTFSSIHANLPNIPVYSLFFHPEFPSLLFAGTEWGLWRCPDVSNPSWEEMTGEVVGRVPVTSITWKPYRYQVDTLDRTDPENPLTEARLVPDPEKPIYISTWGRGVWKLNGRSATALPGLEATLPIHISAYPNPFSHLLTLRFCLPTGAQRLSWQLLSLTGQRITGYTCNRRLPAGEHRLSWVPPVLPSGLYLLQVEVQEIDGKQYTHTLKVLRE